MACLIALKLIVLLTKKVLVEEPDFTCKQSICCQEPLKGALGILGLLIRKHALRLRHLATPGRLTGVVFSGKMDLPRLTSLNGPEKNLLHRR